MRSWFSSSSTIINLTIKTTDGELEDKIQIQSDESVQTLKSLIDDKFECDPDLQKLVFHGEILQDNKPLSSYKITNNSTILIMKADNQQTQTDPQSTSNPIKRRSIFDKSNPYYQSQSELSEPGKNDNNNTETPKYFDPVLNELAKFHPELPMAVMQHSKSVGELMKNLNKNFECKSDINNSNVTEQQKQSLTAYYYYLSLASISAATTSIASSVYQSLPSKQQISSTVQSIIKTKDNEINSNSFNNDTEKPSWFEHLQKLISNTKQEKEAIDRLVILGFNRKQSIEAYLACDKDEVCAAVFLYQNQETKGNDIDDQEEKKDGVDASIGYIGKFNEKMDLSMMNTSVFFKQFQIWIRNIFSDDRLYFRYLLLFMKYNIADMSCLEDINYDEEYLINIGFEHKLHRNRIIKAIANFVKDKNEFEIWWNKTIQFKKYLLLFKKYGIWDKEELLLQIRNCNDIKNKIGIMNKDDVESILKHIHNLRMKHSLYSDVKETMETINNVIPNMYNNINYSAPPMEVNNEEIIMQKEVEGAVTQI